MKVYLPVNYEIRWTTVRPGIGWLSGGYSYPKHARVMDSHTGNGITVWYEYVANKTIASSTVSPTSDTDNWDAVTTNPILENPWWLFTETYAKGDQVNYDHLGSKLYYSYESLIADNAGNNPHLDDGTRWLNLGPANAAAMFDERNNTKTIAHTNPLYLDSAGVQRSGVSFRIYVTGKAVALMLLGLKNITEVTIVQRLANNTTAKTQVFNLGTDYDNESVLFLFDKTTATPEYNIDVYLKQPSATALAEIGNLLLSDNIITLGNTQWGAEPNFISYSTFDTNEWGSTTFVPRVSQRETRATIEFETDDFDTVYSVCDNLSRGLAFFDFNNDEETNFDALRVYGALTSFSANLDSEWSTVGLTVRGYV
jgi:hypothetical protein